MDINNLDLNQLDLNELKKLRKGVEKAIVSFEDRKKREALAELEKTAAEMGFSLSELTGATKGKPKGIAKYRNPANPEQTWTGRGRTPQWVKDLEDAGGSRETAAI